MIETKTYVVVVQRTWADELGAILEPYLHPLSAPLEHFRALYAIHLETQLQFVEATLLHAPSGVRVVLRFPHAAVRLIIETPTQKATPGFL
jgi:hypothetical protein